MYQVYVLTLLVLSQTVSTQESGWPAWPTWPTQPAKKPAVWPTWPSWPSASEPSPAPVTSTPTPTPTPTPTAPSPFMVMSEMPSPVAESPSPVPIPEVSPSVPETVAVVSPEVEVVEEPMPSQGYKTVADFLAANEEFSFQAAFVDLAGYTEAFMSEDFTATIFVYKNDAANELLREIYGEDATPDSVGIVEAVDSFNYNIIPDVAAFSTDLQNRQFLKTALGDAFNLRVLLGDGTVEIQSQAGSKGKVIQADIVAGKSIIHVLDTALIAKNEKLSSERFSAEAKLGVPEFESVSQAVESMKSLGAFGTALQAAGLSVSGSTVIIPTNAAFNKLLKTLELESLEELAADTELLTAVLNYHMISDLVLPTELTNQQKLSTMAGQRITVNSKGFLIFIGAGSRAKVINYFQAGGVYVYVVDNVLLPIELPEES